ncbi:unnamed protein product, partial [marine sediment metagenome]
LTCQISDAETSCVDAENRPELATGDVVHIRITASDGVGPPVSGIFNISLCLDAA